MMRHAMFFVLPALAAAACGGTDPVATATAPPVAPAAACQHKATWTTAVACLDCASRCVQAPCTCSPGPANGNCFDLNKKRSAACETSVNDCVLACSTDCACIGRCYDAHAACAAASAELEGCILQTCDPSCK